MKRLTLILILVLLFALSGCSKGSDNKPNSLNHYDNIRTSLTHPCDRLYKIRSYPDKSYVWVPGIGHREAFSPPGLILGQLPLRSLAYA